MYLPPFCWRLLSPTYLPTKCSEVTFSKAYMLLDLRVALTQAKFAEFTFHALWRIKAE